MKRTENIDVIVVGAGPSGCACAITVARSGYKVLLIEKAHDAGVKNMYGGALYLESIKELLPDCYDKAPYERFITSHNYVILNDDNSTSITYKNSKNKTTATSLRRNFDSWLVERAIEAGVYYAPSTLVVDIIKDGNKITGVKTEYEEIYAPITVIAEGFNSLLSNKAGLKEKNTPLDAILAVKETIRFNKDELEKKFSLKGDEGSMYEFFGGMDESAPFCMGFMYTFKNTVSVGMGILMKDLVEYNLKPHEYLDKLKNKPFISSLIEGGEVVEYSAHSIPEGGYNKIPKLYFNGALLVGDCANLVDSVHFEGTNLAIKSGMLAGEASIFALKKNDFSEKTLKIYKKKLYQSFIAQDMKAYKNVVSTLFKRKKSVFYYYPKKIDEFFEMFTTANNQGKKKGYRSFICGFLKDRSLSELINDVISFVKCAIEAII